MEDPATFLLWGTEISMSHALGKGESPFLREFSFAEGQFRLTESEKKEKRKKKNVRGWMSTSHCLERQGKSQDLVALSQDCCCCLYHTAFLLLVNSLDGYKILIMILGHFYHGL